MLEDQPAECGTTTLGTGKLHYFYVFLKVKLIFFIRSTPRVDGYWGGKNDLIAAIGFEKDGVTTIAFRKKLKGDITFHKFGNIYYSCTVLDSNKVLYFYSHRTY